MKTDSVPENAEAPPNAWQARLHDAPSHVRELLQRAQEHAEDLAQRTPQQIRDLVERMPARKRRRRHRALVVGMIVGIAAAVTVGIIFVKKVFAPGVGEEPLGGPYSSPATGSGTGWAEPLPSPERSETVNGAGEFVGARGKASGQERI